MATGSDIFFPETNLQQVYDGRTQPSPIIMMNFDILESDKVSQSWSLLCDCVTNGEAAAAACDIVSRDPDRGCV